MSLPTFSQPIEGKSVQIKENLCIFKVTGKDTEGHAGLFEFILAPGAKGATPHIHKQMTEVFYVVTGEVEFLLGKTKTSASQGACIVVPDNTTHGFSNPGQTSATLLLLFCPDNNRAEYFTSLEELTKNGREPTKEELAALMARFDQYLVPDPEE